jgi:hypothetical protein
VGLAYVWGVIVWLVVRDLQSLRFEMRESTEEIWQCFSFVLLT